MLLQLLKIGDGRSQHLDFPYFARTGTDCAPVQNALLPDIKVAHQNNADVYQHLPETKHLKLAQDDRPGVKENGLYIKQNEKHGHQVELDREPSAGISDRSHSAFVGGKLGAGGLAITDEPGESHNHRCQSTCYHKVDQKGQVTSEVIVRHRGAIYNSQPRIA